jgi:predicted LPLAT superfamily acyltransferase
MDHMWTRLITQLAARVTGPMKFRLVLQPAMAAFFAIRAGLADARAGKPPYFWGLVSDSSQRDAMLKDGWKSVGRVFILALVLDVVYQIIVLHFIYVGEAIIVAFLLAILPYLILRGLVTRLARRNYARRQHDLQTPLHSSQGSR